VYKRWTPSSRRDRRRSSRRSRERHQAGTDRIFFIVLGAFVILALLALVLIFLVMRPGG
jgi:flagellar basal body-associated protein FliL